MNDIEIARNQWWQFCELFSQHHHGWPVTLRQLASEDLQAGRESAAKVLYPGYRSLEEVREGQQGERIELMVTVAEGTQDTSFLIADAIALYRRNIGETHQGLRIDSGNGKSTLLEFHGAAKP